MCADSTSETIEALKRQIQELDQKVRILERKGELEKEAATEKAKTTPIITAGAGGFSISSPDTNFVLKLRGYVQADGRYFFGDNPTVNDTFLLRRVRPILEGTLFKNYDYRIMLDFGSGASSSAANNANVQDAYLNARLWPQFQIQAGKFKEPVGLERLQSGANMLFVERSYPTQLLPNRDVGIQVHGDLFDGRLNYALGVFNGVSDGGSGDTDTTDDEKDFAGRLFAQPLRNSGCDALRGLGFGVAGTYGDHCGAPRSYTSPGQQRIFAYRSSTTTGTPNVVADGTAWRLSPQLSYYWGPFGLYAEYAVSSQELVQGGGGAGAGTRETLENHAWQVSVSYFLTGEANSFRAVIPRKPFVRGGDGWGAWEVAARVSQIEFDDAAFPFFANPATSARKATSYGLGLNWHLNRNVKLNFNYEYTTFDGGETGAATANDENVFFTRAQFSF
jgi:phosphate-selective porin OprO/OprP